MGKMAEGLSKLEAVRRALEQLGEATPQEIAAWVERHHGLKLRPQVVPILRASLREQEHLAKMRRLAREAVEQARARESGERGA
jgi:hypothetical protein